MSLPKKRPRSLSLNINDTASCVAHALEIYKFNEIIGISKSPVISVSTRLVEICVK